jgi:maltooligosyltrehalose trehalohydrolase
LVEAVRLGRRGEFAAFGWQAEPPDPQDETTFLRSRVNHSLRHSEPHQILCGFYQELIKLRKTLPGLARPDKQHLEVHGLEPEKVLLIRRWSDAGEALVMANFCKEPKTLLLAIPGGQWHKTLDSADQRWQGPGSSVPASFESGGEAQLSLSPESFLLFQRGAS